jgi:16S rRNA (guanine527-N7)-methyltransferase
MIARRLAELADRFNLDPGAAERLMTLLDSLAGDPLAPTSVRDRPTALDDHIADSLVALDLPEVRAAGSIADIGSGAGLPGLPLAIALPGASVALVESNARKCAFIERAAVACGASNTSIVRARAESWPEGLERFDLVTARALAPLDVVEEWAAPLLRLGGTLVVWRGRRDAEAEAAAARAADQLGLELAEARPVQPYATAEHRHLHVMHKARPTPSAFPRRPGIARKRPLGAVTLPSDRSQR